MSKGVLNARRKALVEMAFNILDKDKSGIITFDEIASVYDASRHPDVISGKLTERKALLDFLDCFDAGNNKDGQVRRSMRISITLMKLSNVDISRRVPQLLRQHLCLHRRRQLFRAHDKECLAHQRGRGLERQHGE